MRFERALEIENFIPAFAVVDQELFSWRTPDLLYALPLVVRLWLERVLIHLGSALLAPRLAQHVLLFLALLQASTIQTLTEVAPGRQAWARGIRRLGVSGDQTLRRSLLEVGHRRLAVGRFDVAVGDTVAQIDLLVPVLLEGLIGGGAALTLRLAALVSPRVAIHLLLGDSRVVQTLMHRPVKEATASCASQILFLLHDLARALRDERFLLDIAQCAAIFESFVHFSLPRLVVL